MLRSGIEVVFRCHIAIIIEESERKTLPKKKKPTHLPFEGREPCGRFAKITHDMMRSPAWQDLTLRQRGLYLHLKSKFTMKRTRGIIEKSNINDISFPKSEWLPKLYSSYRSFNTDMRKLMDNGFIQIVSRGGFERKCNIYGFTKDWVHFEPTKP